MQKISLVPKKERPKKDLSQELSYIFLLLLFLLFVGSFVFFEYTSTILSRRAGELNIEISNQEAPQIKKMEEKLRRLNNILSSLEVLLEQRSTVSPYREFLEKTLHPLLVPDKVSFMPSSNQIILEGAVGSFLPLAQQIRFWEKNKEVESVKLDSLYLEEGEGISYKLIVVLKGKER